MKTTRLEKIQHLFNLINSGGHCVVTETAPKFRKDDKRCTECPLAHSADFCRHDIIKACMKDVLKEYLFSDNPEYLSRQIVKEEAKRYRKNR